jgi:hypothetical protein
VLIAVDIVDNETDEKGWMYCTIALVLIISIRGSRCDARKGLSSMEGLSCQFMDSLHEQKTYSSLLDEIRG